MANRKYCNTKRRYSKLSKSKRHTHSKSKTRRKYGGINADLAKLVNSRLSSVFNSIPQTNYR